MPAHSDDGMGDRASDRESPSLVLAGRALLQGRIQPLEVGISESGWIVRLGRNLRGNERRDLGERVLLPAATDLHVHLRDPSAPPAAESFPTGTTGAALGGVTLVGEMPNTEPVVDAPSIFLDKARRAEGRMAVDVLLYGAARTPAQVASLAGLVGAYKLFLSPTSGIDDPPGPIGLPPLLRAVADTRLGLSVHAEDPKMFGRQPAVDPAGWNAARPPSAELLSVRSLIDAAPDNLRLHVAHVTTVNAAQLLREKGFSFESTPHHLLLSEKTGRGTWGKVNPPLRSPKDRAALFDEFVSGRVPCLASDHAPHSVQEKEKSFSLAPSGVPGVETMLPLFLSHVREGRVPLPTLLQAACDRPARWLGMPHGRIAVGHRAHLIAVDFRQRSRIAGERLASPCGWTPFEGKPAIFPTHHFRHGRLIVEDGQFVGLHDGRVVRPEYAP